MEIINVISSIGTLVIALIGIWIAIAQLKSANRATHASRMAEMSWQVYQAYTDSKIRDARGAAEKIAHTVPALTSGVEYGKKYADKKQFVPEPKKLTLDIHMRRLLRFYNQVGSYASSWCKTRVSMREIPTYAQFLRFSPQI